MLKHGNIHWVQSKPQPQPKPKHASTSAPTAKLTDVCMADGDSDEAEAVESVGDHIKCHQPDLTEMEDESESGRGDELQPSPKCAMVMAAEDQQVSQVCMLICVYSDWPSMTSMLLIWSIPIEVKIFWWSLR